MWEEIALLGGSMTVVLVVRLVASRLSVDFSNLLNPRRLQDWQNALVACGLTVQERPGAWAWHPRIKAWAGPLDVWIEDAPTKEQRTQVVVAIRGPSGFLDVKIRGQLLKPPWASTIEVGDGSFDGAFYILGPLRLVSALLDAETRRLLIKLNAKSKLELVRGELRAKMFLGQLPDLLPLLLSVGQRLARPLDVTQRLAENAEQDPEAGVRRQSLLLLLGDHGGTPMAVETLRKACSDASPQIRLQAAKRLGAEGCSVLVELAESMEDDAVSAQAISALGRALPIEHTRDILVHALRRRHLQTGRACLEQFARNGDPADVDVLAKVLARETGELAVAAANALGHLGATAAVMLLKEAAERSPHDYGIHKATRQAIAEIQSRLPGASPGQLSLAGVEVGKLSLVQAEAGELSLASDPVGQLDLDEPMSRPV